MVGCEGSMAGREGMRRGENGRGESEKIKSKMKYIEKTKEE